MRDANLTTLYHVRKYLLARAYGVSQILIRGRQTVKADMYGCTAYSNRIVL
jgi:hypothetical protein